MIAQTILEQIKFGRTSDDKSGKIAMMCWAARGYKASKDTLTFKVSGAKFKGNVAVTLDEGKDLYVVKFYNTRWTLKQSYDDVYCDQLTQLIDEIVEAA